MYSRLLFPLAIATTLMMSTNSPAFENYPGAVQAPPADTARIFAPDLVSTDRNEHFGPTFSPDGDLMIWSFFTRDRGMQMLTRTGTGWRGPEHLSFNLPFKEDGPCFSPDGRRLYFYSQRPVVEGETKEDWDLWYVEREDDGWSQPRNLGAPINTERNEIFHAVTADTSLYFCTLGPPRVMYRSEWTGDTWTEPVKLPDTINVDLFYSHAWVAPDESCLIFSSTRAGGYGSADLYISRRDEDGSWLAPRNLGPGVNTDQAERSPCVTPDGRSFFFMRHELTTEGGGYCCGDMYWISASVLDED